MTSMGTTQWDSKLYDQAHSFVWKYGASLLPELNAQSGERIVDLGCGTGHLTSEIAATGALVTGLDSSAEMIERARSAYPTLDFRVQDARDFRLEFDADAVFSNAALHWVQDAEAAVGSIARTLRRGGRFVAEFGGAGNTRRLLAGVREALRARGIGMETPWYYPSIGEYSALLERHRLEVRQASLFDRPTPLEEGDEALRNWLRMFGQKLLSRVPAEEYDGVMADIETGLRPALFSHGRWTVDYRRIRVNAVKLV